MEQADCAGQGRQTQNNRVIDMDIFLIFLTITLCVVAFFWTYKEVCELTYPESCLEYIMDILLGFCASAMVFLVLDLTNHLYWGHKKETDEITYCMKKIERGCKGWEYVITDKYSKLVTRVMPAGKCVIPITETEYYISYRINEIGTDDYESNTLNVSKSVYDYYGSDIHQNEYVGC